MLGFVRGRGRRVDRGKMGGVGNGWPEKDMKRERRAPIRLGRARVDVCGCSWVGIVTV